jgi:hypothetical protein
MKVCTNGWHVAAQPAGEKINKTAMSTRMHVSSVKKRLDVER